jgi:hypothetical protein
MRFGATLTACALAMGSVAAQVPPGHYVVSGLRVNNGATLGGLAIVHPTGAVPPTIITGLADDLTGANMPGVTAGANCVVHSPDSFLIAGPVAQNGAGLQLHQVLVVGGAAILDQPVFVGTAMTAGSVLGVTQLAMLANGNVVFSVHGLDNTGPLGGAGIGLLDRSTQAVSPIPIAMPQGSINCLLVDEPNGLIYFGMFGTGDIWSTPLAGGAVSSVAQVGSYIWNLAMDESGNLLVGVSDDVHRIDPQTSQTLETFPSVGGLALGVAIERATADPLVYVSGSGEVSRLRATGNLVVATVPLGHASGITVVNSVAEYGAATPGATDYAFRTFPGVGGLPVAGNLSHALQVDASNGNANLGVLVASFGQSSLPLLGIQLLVDPASAVALGAFPAGSSVPFAIPPGLLPTPVYLQSIHLDAGSPNGLASTRGLQLTTIE